MTFATADYDDYGDKLTVLRSRIDTSELEGPSAEEY